MLDVGHDGVASVGMFSNAPGACIDVVGSHCNKLDIVSIPLTFKMYNIGPWTYEKVTHSGEFGDEDCVVLLKPKLEITPAQVS